MPLIILQTRWNICNNKKITIASQHSVSVMKMFVPERYMKRSVQLGIGDYQFLFIIK